MKFLTNGYDLTATSAGASQALSGAATKVSLFAEAAMNVGVVPGPLGSTALSTITSPGVGTAKVMGITFTNDFNVGDVLRFTVDGTNLDLTVTTRNNLDTAAALKTLAEDTAAITAEFLVGINGNVVRFTRSAVNTDFTLSSTIVSRNVPHHIGANERLTIEVPRGSTILAKASSGTLNISELE